MARMNRMRRDGDAHYHVMSRTNARRYLFENGAFKDEMVGLLKRTAAFSGVEVEAYAIMDNHFHAVVHVTKPETPVDEATVLARIRELKGLAAAERLRKDLDELRLAGRREALERELDRWRRRMHDVSEFMKTYKELVNLAYKEETSYSGSIWDGRFKSTLVEDGEYLRTCIRYVELNPVRAGIVKHWREYRWSSRASETANSLGFAGSVPAEGEVLMRRVAQIGSGKVFGGLEFVTQAVLAFGHLFAGRCAARPVFGTAYATHGWRLARRDAAREAS